MGRLPRCSLPSPRIDVFVGPDSIVSGPGTNDRRKQSSLSDYVHIVADGGDSGDCVVRPSPTAGTAGTASSGRPASWKQHLPAQPGSGQHIREQPRAGHAGARKGKAATRTTTGTGEAGLRTTAPGMVACGGRARTPSTTWTRARHASLK
jgi:hypothetical protein